MKPKNISTILYWRHFSLHATGNSNHSSVVYQQF
jgi:hypothetical protein